MANTAKTLTIDAPCKINLALDIVGLLPNGYHEMDMVMESIGLCDRITLTVEDGDEINMLCDDGTLACDGSNICVRCAKAFLEATGLKKNVLIDLKKHIPMMAGLGGGSADGAAVLCGLNKLCETNLSCEKLCEIGFKIGADIPFCIKGGSQRAKGAGEVLSDVPALSEKLNILVVKPNFSVSTGAAFKGFDEQENPSRADVEGMIKALEGGELSKIAAKLHNVFEPFCKPEEIGAIKAAMLSYGAAGALMSGSGSAVFGIFEDEAKAIACGAFLQPTVEQVDVVHPVSKGCYGLCE